MGNRSSQSRATIGKGTDGLRHILITGKKKSLCGNTSEFTNIREEDMDNPSFPDECYCNKCVVNLPSDGELRAEGNLSPTEAKALEASVALWDAILSMPVEHPDDNTEFRHHIHAIQDKIMSRPTRRAINSQ